MRKTRKCSATALRLLAGRLLARTCDLSRGHDEEFHHDHYGAWTL